MADESAVDRRGTFEFEITSAGDLVNSATNVEALRKLWLDHMLVIGEDLGPGDRGDFDHGAWHVACHLAGAGGVRRAADGRLLWLEISHKSSQDEYYASVTANTGAAVETLQLDSAEGRTLLRGSNLLGFVEGNSTGRISARGVNDSTEVFNLWRRQDFDQPIESSEDGGKVWEHWCTLREIRQSSRIASSVLSAYVSLAAALGDRFAPTVARGRKDYGHPVQLAALVRAGFTATRSACWDITPTVLPPSAERLLLLARPASALEAVESLQWGRQPRYYMFARRIKHWNHTREVQHALKQFRPGWSG